MKNFVFVLFIAVFSFSGSAVAQTTSTQCIVRGAEVVAQSYDPVTRTGKVVLSHPQAGEVVGEALAPADRFPTQAQARLMALEGAKTVAYGKLAERLCGVSVTK